MNFLARLIDWLIGPLLFVWLISLGVTFLAARDIVERALDDRLNTLAHILRDDLYRQQLALGLPAYAGADLHRWLTIHPDYPISFAIGDDRGWILAGDDTLAAFLKPATMPVIDLPERLDERMVRGFNASQGSEFIRVLRARIDRAGERDILVVLMQSRDREDGLLRSIMLREAMPQTLVLLGAVFLLWFGLRVVSKPIRRLKRDIDARPADDLRPLPPESVPVELAPLIHSINAMMARLATARDGHQRFIANAAHQLRTPLAALRTQADNLTQASSEAEREAALASLTRTIERVSKLSAQMLSLARAESISSTAAWTEVDLATVCEEAAQDSLPAALAKQIDLEFVHLPRVPIRMKAEATLLGEALRNLIDNAIKYGPQQGLVRVSVHPEPPRVIVEDNGPGIDPADRERIFAPFTRTPRKDAATGQWVSGSGLGLAIVREVAMLHRAKIEVGVSEWGGARFTLIFPFEREDVFSLH